MKRLSFLLAVVLCALAASATNYVGRMTVTGDKGQAVKDGASVTMTKNANGTYKAVLNDFIISYNGVDYNLGTLEYDNLTGTTGSDGYTSVSGTRNMTVKDIEGYEQLIPEQYRNYLDYVRDDTFPVNFSGKFNDNDMTANIKMKIVVNAGNGGYSATVFSTDMNIDFNGNAVGVKGDVNGDDIVDVVDMNMLINIVLGKDDASKYGNRPYVVGSTIVSISDINAVINITLGKG